MSQPDPTPSDPRLARRVTFDEIPAEYDHARPPYPEPVLAELFAASGVGPGDRVLELGPGTGQLTLPLAATGASVVAVELGAGLAELLRGRAEGRGEVEVVVADFDTWDARGRTFDHVMSASAFHWFDPETRLTRCHALLEPGGTLGIVDVRWGVRTPESDDLFSKIQACYQRWDPRHDPHYWHPTPEEVPGRLEAFRSSGLFEGVRHLRRLEHRTYSKGRFLALINTYSTVRSWAPGVRTGFMECVAALFDRWFPEGVTQTDVYDVTVGRAAR